MNTERIKEIQERTGFPNSVVIQQALLQVWNESVQENKWKPISSAPKDGTYIMLLMNSGYTSTPYAVIIAQYDKSYPRGTTWRDHANDSIFDGFQEIIDWKGWKIPEIDFNHCEGLYTYLKHGQKIQIGDEFERSENNWEKLSDNDIDVWKNITGSDLVYEKGNRRVRREKD